ncbi:MAG: GGDEF domain-containing protein [Sedimentisphaerales bacterium]|jgi:PleD family two-component response regulator
MNSNTPVNKTILLIGDPAASLAETQPPDKLPIRVCTGLLEGIEAAVKNQFAVIAVAMSGTAANFRRGLATLRKNTSAKILLLARMSEEPKAIELAGNGTGLADGYVIRPVRIEKLFEALHGATTAVDDRADAAVQTKIRRLEKLATEDELTGLKNRRYIQEFARQIIERSRKNNGRVTILVFDIDNFKNYNDVYGHAVGDEVLKQAALLIRRCCRRHDVVARLGGDEFAVVFWDDPRRFPPSAEGERRSSASDHPNEVISIAKRFRRELKKADLRLLGTDGKGILTISGGLAGLGKDGSTTQELFTKADYALLDAKHGGKNRVYLVGQPETDIDKIE